MDIYGELNLLFEWREQMQLIGRIQWWDEKYGKGVIEDAEGNEYYFDQSVTSLKPHQKISKKQIVTFRINESIKDVVCAHKVSIPTIKKKTSVTRRFGNQVQKSASM